MVEEVGLTNKQAAAARREAMRRDYEESELSVAEVAAKYKVGVKRVYGLRAENGWRLRRPSAHVDRSDVIKTMLLVLKRQLTQLERDTSVPGEKEAAVLASLSRSLEKLVTLDKAESASAGQQVSQMEHARLKLIRRMAELDKN